MTFCKKIHDKLIPDKIFYFIFLPVSFFLFVVAFLLILYPQSAFNGIKEGIDACLETVIPSLFPFLVISNIAYDLGVFRVVSAKADKLMAYLFALPSEACPIILMSLLGGYPVGAALIEKAYDSGYLSQSQSQRMLMFCVNPGPAFVVSTVGYAVIGSVQTGWIIYAAITLSSLIIGVLSRFIAVDEDFILYKNKPERSNIMSADISKTLSNCTKNMMNICVWVVIFSCLGNLAEILPVSKGSLNFYRMVSEVTSGTIIASKHFALPVVAAVISFAGFCVHFQVMPCLIKVKLKYKYFLSVRILCASLSCVITYFLTKIFPQYSEVISMGRKPEAASLKASPTVCVFMMLMCGLFILGDNYIVSKKTAKHQR